jgi:AcrR family transcriptional regulator
MSAADVPTAGIDRREEIIGVACDLFFSKGFGAASMRDIADQIGFTQAAIYYHFRSKDEILFAVIDDFSDRLYRLLDRAMHETGDPLEDLKRTICAHVMVSRTHYREIKLVLEDKKLLSQPFADRIREHELRIYNLYKTRIKELAAAGLCAPIEPSVATFTALAAITFVYQWYRPDGAMKLEAVAQQTMQMLIEGLIAPRPVAVGGVTQNVKQRKRPLTDKARSKR